MRRWIGVVVLAAGVVLAAQRFVESPSVLVLNRGATAMSLLVDGHSKLIVKKGDVQVNSSHIHALFMGFGTLIAEDGQIGVVGGMAWHGDKIDPQPVRAEALDNPYEFLGIPAVEEVRSEQRLWIEGDTRLTLKPGVYYDGMTVGGGSQISFEPGLYVIVDGDLWIQNGCLLRGEGVTLVMAGQRPGSMTVGHETVMQLEAPDEGPLEGVVFGSTAKDKSTIFWGGETTLEGLVYTPMGRFEVLNTAKVEAGAIVCDTLKVSNGGEFTVTGEARVPRPKEGDGDEGAGR